MRILVLLVAIIITGLMSWLWPQIDRPPSRFEVASQLLKDGRADEAALLFDDPIWRGVAEYRAERYDRAIGEFYSQESTLTLYNLGTTHAQLLEWTSTVGMLEQVLRLEPNHVDAKHNLAVALKAIALTRGDSAQNAREQPLDGEGDNKQDAADFGQEDPSQSQSGDSDDEASGAEKEADEEGDYGDSPGELGDEKRTDRIGTAVAFGEPKSRGEQVERTIDRLTLKARESQQAAEILLRYIQDDPEKVLRSRLYIAHQIRQAAKKP